MHSLMHCSQLVQTIAQSHTYSTQSYQRRRSARSRTSSAMSWSATPTLTSCQISSTSSMQLTHLYSPSCSSAFICRPICPWNDSSSLQFLNTGSMHFRPTAPSTLSLASSSICRHCWGAAEALKSRMARVSSPGPMEERPFMKVQKDLTSITISFRQLNTDFMYMMRRSRSKLRNLPCRAARSACRCPTISRSPSEAATPAHCSAPTSPDCSPISRAYCCSTLRRQPLKTSSGSTSSYSSISKSKSRISLRISAELGLIFWLRRASSCSSGRKYRGSSSRRKCLISASVTCLNWKGFSMQGLSPWKSRSLEQTSSISSASRQPSMRSCISSAHSRSSITEESSRESSLSDPRLTDSAKSHGTDSSELDSSFAPECWLERESVKLDVLQSYSRIFSVGLTSCRDRLF